MMMKVCVLCVLVCGCGKAVRGTFFLLQNLSKLLYKVLFDDDDDFVTELGTQHIVYGNGAKLLYFRKVGLSVLNV